MEDEIIVVGSQANRKYALAVKRVLDTTKSTKEGDSKLRNRLQKCLDSLGKFPLPLPSSGHCKMLEGFNSNIIALIEAQLSCEPGEQKCTSTTTSCDLQALDISPIAYRYEIIRKKKSENNENDWSSGTVASKEMCQEVEKSSPVCQIESELRENQAKSQEEADFEFAMKLSQEINGPDNRELALREEEDFIMAQKLHEENYRIMDLNVRDKNCDKNSSSDEDINLNDVSISPLRNPVPNSPNPSSPKQQIAQDLSRKLHEMSDSDESDNATLPSISVQLENIRKAKQSDHRKSPTTSTDMARPLTKATKLHDISDSDTEECQLKPAISSTKRAQNKKSQPAKKMKQSKQDDFIINPSEVPSWIFDSAGQTPCQTSNVADDSIFKLFPGDYEIILLVDTQEVSGVSCGGKKNSKIITVNELSKSKIPFETRKLNIGDFGWIARKKFGSRDPSQELVLPYIVERKRLDDLKASIHGSRYEEQKFRLKKCGLKHIIYLVEGFARHKKYWAQEKDLKMFATAIASTAVREGFSVELTESQKDTVTYLGKITNDLQKKYENKTLSLCSSQDLESGAVSDVYQSLMSFKDFNDDSKKSKSLSVSDIFVHMLVQQAGVTTEIAYAIADKYISLGGLMRAYNECQNDEDKENLLLGLEYDRGVKKIRSNISKAISWLYNDSELL